MNTATEHPFAEYVRILGKGKTSGRSLSFDEANTAFSMILSGQVEELQLGAFLLLLRVKGEDANEMAGFAKASADFIQTSIIETTTPDNKLNCHVDIDWPSYAGKHKQNHWNLLAALLLADAGFNVFMHGSAHHTANRLYSQDVIQTLGIPLCETWAEADKQLQAKHFAFMPTGNFCPALNQLFSYRALLGVRSPAHSFIKLVNPSQADCVLQSIFHPAYAEVHQQAAAILGFKHSVVMKGEGGELEYRPDAINKLLLSQAGSLSELTFSRKLADRQPAQTADTLSAEALRALWQSEFHLADLTKNANMASDLRYGLYALLGTVALILLTKREVNDEAAAWDAAQQLWLNRNKNSLS